MRRTGTVTLRLPKSPEAIADSFAGPLLAMMPLHDRLGRDDCALLRGAMHVGLAAISDRFSGSANVPQLAWALAVTA